MGLDQEARNWQSPQARDYRDGSITPETAAKHLGSRPLNEEVMNWPTARAEDAESCGNHPNAIDSLRGAALNWGTPRLGTNSGMGQENPDKGSRLEDQALNWLTPCGGSGIEQKTGKEGAGGEHAEQATTWEGPSLSPRTEPEITTDGRMCWCLTPGCALPLHKRKLNIYFDEWLMGWPINWSSAEKELIDFEQWETESRRLLWRLLSSHSQRRMVSKSRNQATLF